MHLARVSGTERLTWAGYVLIGFIATAFGSSLPVLRTELGASYAQLSLIFVFQAIGNTAAYFTANPLVDRVGARRVFLWGLMLFALFDLPLLVTHSLRLWLLASMVLGVAFAFTDVGASRIVNELYRPKPAHALNRLNLFWGVGAVLGPAAVALGVHFGLGSTLAFLCVFLIAAGSGLILVIRHGVGERPSQPEVRENPAVQTLAMLRSEPWLRLLAVTMFFYICAEGSFGSWIAAYVHVRARLAPAAAALFPSVYQGGLTIVRVAAGPLIGRLRLDRLIPLGGLVAIVGGILVGVGGQIIWLDLLGTLISGIGYALVFPVALAIASERAPGREGITYGVLFQSLALAALMAPWLVGQIFYRSPMLAILCTPLAGLLMSLAAAPLQRRST